MNRSSHRRCSVRKVVLRNFKFTGKHLCQSLFFNNSIKKEHLAQVFFCKFCEIFRNTFYRTPSGQEFFINHLEDVEMYLKAL